MEPQPGVFVTNVSTADWEADPEIGGLMHLLCDVPGLEAGLTRFDTSPAPLQYTPEKRETFLILEGRARIDIVGGATLDLGHRRRRLAPRGHRVHLAHHRAVPRVLGAQRVNQAKPSTARSHFTLNRGSRSKRSVRWTDQRE